MSTLIVVNSCAECVLCDKSKVEPTCKAHEDRRVYHVPVATIPVLRRIPIPDWCPLPVEIQKS